jgi:TrmH family RNA methyltransferase
VLKKVAHNGSSDALPPVTRKQAEELRGLVREAASRLEAGAFVIEGPHLIERALESLPKKIEFIAATAKAMEANPVLIEKIKKFKIPFFTLTSAISERISDTRSPQGIYARVIFSESRSYSPRGDVIVVLDGIQDPGNLGTIIRTSAWFGVKQVVLGAGCADAFSPKVLRSTQGEIFTVEMVQKVDLASYLNEVKNKGYRILATTLSEGAGSLYKTARYDKTVVIFGSEAHGISSEILQLADESVMIPRFGGAESLNVAISAGIVLAELARTNSEK